MTSGEERPTWDGGRSGRPAPAFEEAARGPRGWGVKPADFAVVGATLAGALGVCCVLWFGFGLQGVPGVTVNPAGDEDISEEQVGSRADQAGIDERAADGAEPAAASSGPDLDAGGVFGSSGSAPAGKAADSQADAGAAVDTRADAGEGVSRANGAFASNAAGATDAGSSAAGAADGDAAECLYAVVQNTEGFYQVLPLDEDTTVTVSGALGTNVIEVSAGRARCVEADCSNQTCVNQGWVSGAGQTIVCLPHKLTVQVVADPAEAAPLR